MLWKHVQSHWRFDKNCSMISIHSYIQSLTRSFIVVPFDGMNIYIYILVHGTFWSIPTGCIHTYTSLHINASMALPSSHPVKCENLYAAIGTCSCNKWLVCNFHYWCIINRPEITATKTMTQRTNLEGIWNAERGRKKTEFLLNFGIKSFHLKRDTTKYILWGSCDTYEAMRYKCALEMG